MSSYDKLAMDRPSPILAQVAGFLQLAPQTHHQVFDGRIGAADLRGDRRMGFPIDALQRKVRCASHPPLHGGQAYLVLPSNERIDLPARTCTTIARRFSSRRCRPFYP
jgi:hypothetical protein